MKTESGPSESEWIRWEEISNGIGDEMTDDSVCLPGLIDRRLRGCRGVYPTPIDRVRSRPARLVIRQLSVFALYWQG